MRVLALIATIPSRKRSCERLLGELARQSQRPDGVVLVLDGYGEEPALACPFDVVLEWRTSAAMGAGNRWRVASQLPPNDIVICLDDDIMLIEAPQLVGRLVDAIKAHGGAAAAMGSHVDGKPAPPMAHKRGELIYAAGCGLSMHAGALAGVSEFADEVRDQGGPDALGLFGDDDALVSAFLWVKDVKIHHAGTGNIFPAPNTRNNSQTTARTARGEKMNAQKEAIRRVTGWPWKEYRGY